VVEDGTPESLRHSGDTEAGDGADDILAEACRARDLLDRLAGKWALLVVYRLAAGPRRFTELRRELDGVSQRMLTVTLRHLERDGLVRRTVYPVVPPRVDYELTPLGTTLLETTRSLLAWIVAHRQEVVEAQAAYDARSAAPRASSAPSGASVTPVTPVMSRRS
jgi:DNA-binding HxlR family transcriptional regulator